MTIYSRLCSKRKNFLGFILFSDSWLPWQVFHENILLSFLGNVSIHFFVDFLVTHDIYPILVLRSYFFGVLNDKINIYDWIVSMKAHFISTTANFNLPETKNHTINFVKKKMQLTWTVYCDMTPIRDTLHCRYWRTAITCKKMCNSSYKSYSQWTQNVLPR